MGRNHTRASIAGCLEAMDEHMANKMCHLHQAYEKIRPMADDALKLCERFGDFKDVMEEYRDTRLSGMLKDTNMRHRRGITRGSLRRPRNVQHDREFIFADTVSMYEFYSQKNKPHTSGPHADEEALEQRQETKDKLKYDDPLVGLCDFQGEDLDHRVVQTVIGLDESDENFPVAVNHLNKVMAGQMDANNLRLAQLRKDPPYMEIFMQRSLRQRLGERYRKTGVCVMGRLSLTRKIRSPRAVMGRNLLWRPPHHL